MLSKNSTSVMCAVVLFSSASLFSQEIDEATRQNAARVAAAVEVIKEELTNESEEIAEAVVDNITEVAQ